MTRVKRGKIAQKRRKKILKLAKGYKWKRKSKYRIAKQAIIKAHLYAFRDRKVRKREKRKLWQIQINAALREKGLKYSTFINRLKEKKIKLNRKMLATLAKEYPTIFEKIIEISNQK